MENQNYKIQLVEKLRQNYFDQICHRIRFFLILHPIEISKAGLKIMVPTADSRSNRLILIKKINMIVSLRIAF